MTGARTRLRWLGLLPLCVLSLLASPAGSDEAWKPFESKAGRFSISMPAPPVETRSSEKSFIGTVTNHIFTAESGPDSFTVDYSDIPHFALNFAGPDTIYEHAKGALLKKTFGKAASYVDATVSGHAGKRLVYETPPAPGHAPMRGHALLVLVGTRLYVIDAVLQQKQSDGLDERYLSSVVITQ